MDMKLIHEINLKMLRDFQMICKKYKLKYYMDSGNLLGAVREKKLIPWDDDIDVTMPRNDYERFKDIALYELPSEYKLCIPGEVSDKYFFDFIPRIIYLPVYFEGDLKEDLFYENNFNRISLDIFVLDNAIDNRILELINSILLMLLYGIALHYRYRIEYEKYKFCQRPIIRVLSFLGRFIPLKYIIQSYFYLVKKGKKNSQDYWIRMNVITYMNIKFKKKWYGEGSSLYLNDEKFIGPKDYDSVLKKLYGDYNIRPDESEQVPKHLLGKTMKFVDTKIIGD